MPEADGRLHAPKADLLISMALAEDLGSPMDACTPGQVVGPILLRNDPTTAATVPPGSRATGRIVAREAGVIAGLPYAARTWDLLTELAGCESATHIDHVVHDGSRVSAGQTLAVIDGPASIVLAGERTALDFVMILSGIATETARWQAAAGSHVRVTDTRKTFPGMRALSKYAVALGGGTNHRAGLWDMVLIKDNHLALAGGVAEAVAAARAARPDLDVEVEAESIAQAAEAAAVGADYVLLDNMDDATVADAVSAVRAVCSAAMSRCVVEVSGGVTFERLPVLASMGVDRVSSSKITLAPPLDVALDIALAGKPPAASGAKSV